MGQLQHQAAALVLYMPGAAPRSRRRRQRRGLARLDEAVGQPRLLPLHHAHRPAHADCPGVQVDVPPAKGERRMSVIARMYQATCRALFSRDQRETSGAARWSTGVSQAPWLAGPPNHALSATSKELSKPRYGYWNRTAYTTTCIIPESTQSANFNSVQRAVCLMPPAREPLFPLVLALQLWQKVKYAVCEVRLNEFEFAGRPVG